jgi:hypothetical protein
LIFLLLASNSARLEEAVLEGSAKMEEALMAALLSLRFFSNFEENFTAAAVAVSSLDGGKRRTPRPNFLAVSLSSDTRFFWL